MKMHAAGEKSIPPVDRVYFEVFLPKGHKVRSKPYHFSKVCYSSHSIGCCFHPYINSLRTKCFTTRMDKFDNWEQWSSSGTCESSSGIKTFLCLQTHDINMQHLKFQCSGCPRKHKIFQVILFGAISKLSACLEQSCGYTSGVTEMWNVFISLVQKWQKLFGMFCTGQGSP